MGTSHPVSGRKVRAAAQQAVDAVNDQGKYLEGFGRALAAHEARLQAMEGVMARGFWGRLRWLVRGQ
jgi:hypothetical protein